jgi:microcystin degradation protein MlrC
MARIAVAGFQHETNSFSPVPADWDAFCRATSWPGLTIGDEVVRVVDGMNLAIAGFLREARAASDEIVPIVWANATPSGPVTDDAFTRIMAIITRALETCGPLDAVFLDLHGSMITESCLDGETEILRRVRATAGDAVPIVASLDLHGNVSPEMVTAADALVACRTYPHVDLAETGARAYAALRQLRSRREPVIRRYRQADFLIPTQAQTTHAEPARGLYQAASDIERRLDLLALSLTLGFGPSDTWHCGPAVTVFGWNARAVDEAVEQVANLLCAAETRFKQPMATPHDAVARAVAVGRPGRPAVLADVQDNPGAGGTGDTTGLLAALIDARADGSVLAVLYDPEAAGRAHEAGVGARLELSLGGKRGGPGSVPLHSPVTVERLGNGRFRATGPMYRGASMDLGPMALIRFPQGPRVIVGSTNTHSADQSILRHLGVEPAEQRIVALKSAVHFRADFEPIASEIILVEAPGSNAADHHAFCYRNLRHTVRVMPR